MSTIDDVYIFQNSKQANRPGGTVIGWPVLGATGVLASGIWGTRGGWLLRVKQIFPSTWQPQTQVDFRWLSGGRHGWSASWSEPEFVGHGQLETGD